MDYQIVDNFLDDWPSFRGYCDKLTYEDVENPADNVAYPGISLAIPTAIEAEVIKRAEYFMGSITPNFMFLRLTTEGMDCPHQAHTDASMGDYSLMLYMNRIEDCIGGTSLVAHKECGLFEQPINEKQLKIWEEDHSKKDKWQITNICSMRPNRAFIFDAKLMHRAEPVGGFGDSSLDGRLVLTMFFNVFKL